MPSKKARLKDFTPSTVSFTNEQFVEAANSGVGLPTGGDDSNAEWVEVPDADTPEEQDLELDDYQRRPPPIPTFEEQPADYYETEWAPGVGYRCATFSRTDVGTHIYSRYTFKVMHLESPMPRAAGRPTTFIKLPLLEKGSRRRPKKEDINLGAYLKRQGVTSDDQIDLRQFLPLHTGKRVYVYKEHWILYDFTRRAECAVCASPLLAGNGRQANNIDNFRFKACCYPPPTMHTIKPKATSSVELIVPVFYDLETTPTPENGTHELYLGVTTVPTILRDLGHYDGKDMLRFNSPEKFFEVVGRTLDEIQANPEMQKKSISVQLVSFNGSRYDDLFLVHAWRSFVYQRWGLAKLTNDVAYSERGGALTFNTLQATPLIEVRWNDLARFVPPTSLRKLAQAFNVNEQKGSMPFQALNDFVRGGPGAVIRDCRDGFLDVDAYYGGDEAERASSWEYYDRCVPHPRSPSTDIDIFCERYCEQDVRVTRAIYECLDELYQRYLVSLATGSPYQDNADDKFQPMCLHSLATMAGKLMLASAVSSTVWGYNSNERRELQEVVLNQTPGYNLSVPQGPTYDYCRQAIAGGWVKGYTQGLITNDDKLDNSPGHDQTTRDLAELEERYKFHVFHKKEFAMFDIASQYPVACTYAMPVGEPEWVNCSTRREELIAQCIAETDPLKIPKFFVRAKWAAPRKPIFCESTLPQRKERTNELRWTYFDDPSATRVVTSLDLWIACHDHTGAPESTWKVYDSQDMLYFPHAAQCYRPFMAACTKIKQDGAEAKNEVSYITILIISGEVVARTNL
jgi:DNA polymerase type B, organellar and viral